MQTKFILCVALILVAVLTTGGVYFYQHQEADFYDRVSRDMELTQSFLENTRAYVRDVSRPAVGEHTDHYIPEAQSSSRVARGIFARFAATHPGFRYKDASDNPLNPENRADAFEADLLRRLREDRTLTQVTGLVGDEAEQGGEVSGGRGSGAAAGNASGRGASEWLVCAKPIVADSSCLKCHGTPDAAPPELVARYGRGSGFGWKVGDVVGAITVRIPTHEVRAAQVAQARRVATWLASVTAATLFVVFLSGQVLVRIPVRRMAKYMAEVAAGGYYDRPLPEDRRSDEIGTAARAFNSVLDVVAMSLGELRAANETLERRVGERTAEIRRSHRHLELLREASLDGIVSMDADGKVTDFNPAAERAFGHKREDAVGKPLAELIIPSQLRDAHRHGLAKYVATGKGPIIGKRLEMSAMRSGGAEFPVELTITAVHLGDNTPPIFTAYVRDLTERRAGEQALRQAFESLRESEERYRVLAEALPHYVWTAGPDGSVEYINGKWFEYSGESSTKTLAGGWATALHPEDVVRGTARWDSARVAGRGYEIEYRLRRADGAYRWHLTRVCPVKVTGAGGQGVTKWVGVTTDIHDRREVEVSLRQRTAELRAVFDSFPDLLFRLGADGTILDYRCGSESELYMRPEQFLNHRVQDVLPAEVARSVAEALDQLKRTRAAVRLEYALPMPDGEEHYEARMLPLGDDEEAVRGQILVVARNVTEQKRAEGARTTLAAIVEGSPDAIYAESLDGVITNWNAGAEALYGYSAAEVIGRHGSMLVPPDRVEEAERVRERVKAGERVAPYETVRLGKGGAAVHVSASHSPLRDAHGRVVGAAKIVRDITDRRRAQGLERERTSLKDAVSAMEQVLGVVGHELRTPLAGLRAMSEYLLTDAARATEEYEQFLGGIHDEVVRMSDTVNDLLEAARLNSGRARWNWAAVPIADACRDAVDSIRPLVDETRVRIALEVRPESAMMAGDADAVRRLVLNLLNNARKHTESGSISVTAECFERGGKGHVRLCVRDTGSGIRPEIATRLGEAFLLNSGVVGDDYCGGSGLGLAICKGIAAAHGGELHVESAPGQGTAITAELRTDLPGPVASGGRIVLVSPGMQLAEASVGNPVEPAGDGARDSAGPGAGEGATP